MTERPDGRVSEGGVSEGTLLGGRVRYAQPVAGYRTGIEPVLLAAAVPARGGQRVLEAGTGAGAGLLCLAARVPGVIGVGIERDPVMAGLARRNMVANGLEFEITEGDVADAAVAGPVDHALANPPWHDPGATRSPDALRDRATHRQAGGLAAWVQPLSRAVTGGTVTLILPAALVGEAVALLHGAGLGRMALLPLWPRAGAAAKIMLVQACRGRASSRVLAGLVLHGAGTGYTQEAEAILRNGGGLVV